jgi:multiple sugar transport system permease protein
VVPRYLTARKMYAHEEKAVSKLEYDETIQNKGWRHLDAPARRVNQRINLRTLKRNQWVGYLFILPQFLGFLIFGLYPLIANLILPFYEWDILSTPQFVAWRNFGKLFSDAVFARALLNTVVYTTQYVVPCLFVSLALALLLNQRIRGMAFFRSIYYIPVVTSYVVAAIVWKWLFDADIGLFNQWLSYLGIPPVSWLLDSRIALSSLVLMSIWKNSGYSVLIYLAALQNIPHEYQEAAQIDGANRWSVFRHITWPLLRPTTFLVVVMLTIWSFQAFAQPYLMTQGGPARATTTLVYYIYQQGFVFYSFGYAALVTTAMTALVFLVTVLQRRFVHEGVL